MNPRFSVEYEFDDALAGRAAGMFVRANSKKLSAKFWAALPVLVLYAVLSGLIFTLGRMLEIPAPIMLIPYALVAIFGGILVLLMGLHGIALLLEAVARWRIRRQLLKPFSSLDRTVRWTFTDDRFEVLSAISDRKVPWSDVRLFVPEREFWLIGIKDGPNLILPVQYLAAKQLESIRDKAEDATLVAPTRAERGARR
jgi:hypothetical protein